MARHLTTLLQNKPFIVAETKLRLVSILCVVSECIPVCVCVPGLVLGALLRLADH